MQMLAFAYSCWHSRLRCHFGFVFYLVLFLVATPALRSPALATAHMHKWKAMMESFRYLQESMLRNSLNRAQLNYGIIFECRTTSNMNLGDEVHFNLQLGDMRGFKRLNPRRKLALFLHGWNDEGSKKWVQDLLKTWTHYDPEYSVCVVDWGHMAQADYKTASMSIFDVGLTVAGIIMAMEELRPQQFSRRNVTIAGYSLGAHAAGYAGSVLNGEAEQIIGLDPAGPLFTLPAVVSATYRLDQTDAQFVQVLHTSGGTLGTSQKSGHADFFPNGGKVPQANCKMFLNLQDMQNTNPIACSHSSAAVFFKQSMNPAYPFVGYNCASWASFALGQCGENRRARFGIHSRRLSQGNFYFNTADSEPYVQRQWQARTTALLRHLIPLRPSRPKRRNRNRNRNRWNRIRF